MAGYLLIASRDLFDSNDVTHFYELAASLRELGNEVTLFLVQNGVLPARPGPRSQPLGDLIRAGVRVLADDFSLKERGITAHRLLSGVQASPLDVVVDALASGTKTLWH